MAVLDDLRSRLRTVAGWLEATPSELVGLAVLLASAVAATGLLWVQAGSAPPAAPAAAPSAPVLTPGTAAPQRVVVHVAGAVAEPGVVELPGGSRVVDALEAAGVAGDADLARLNLASVLEDGQQLVVPRVGQPAPRPDGGTGDGQSPGPVDLNEADAGRLEELPGIGPVLAERIVAWREQHGSFDEVGQLRQVTGIGERTVAGLADQVTVR